MFICEQKNIDNVFTTLSSVYISKSLTTLLDKAMVKTVNNYPIKLFPISVT